MKSILNEVIYINVKVDVLEITEIFAIKYSDSKIEYYDSNEHNKCDFKKFIDNCTLIIHSEGNEIKLLLKLCESMNVTIMNSMELAAILEPWQREYTLRFLLSKITNCEDMLEEIKNRTINTIYLVNALLCRQWQREENNHKKVASLYYILVQDYDLLHRWSWTKYLEKPLFFDSDEYSYVLFKDKKEKEDKLYKKKIRYEKYEELLEEVDLWNSGSNSNYQYRSSQKEFSRSIRENIENESRLFIEAPTGSGKTFAYVLIAAIKSYLNNRGAEDSSFIISTDTKELQNQLIERDIPKILKKLRLIDKIKFGAMKGKSNYICTERLLKTTELKDSLEGMLVELFLLRLCKDGEHGDREKINYWAYTYFNIEKYINYVICDKDECNLEKCYKPCYLRKRYNEIGMENITVINHSLLASWPYNEKKKITHLIVDEAHNLMEKCYDYFSEEINSDELDKIIQHLVVTEPTIYRQLVSLNASNGYRELIELEKIKYWVREIELAISMTKEKCYEMKICVNEYGYKSEIYLDRDNKKKINDSITPLISQLKEKIYALYSVLKRYFNNITLDGEEGKDEHEYSIISLYLINLKEIFDIIDRFLSTENDSGSFGKIFEIDSFFSNFSIKNVPINVDKLFNENVLKDVKSVTFLSATMRVDNSFKRIKEILGQQIAKELVVNPTFNLNKQTKIFLPNDLGKYNSKIYIDRSAQFIYEIAQKLNGHILVLFTSNSRRDLIGEKLKKYIENTDFEVYTNKKAISYLNEIDKKVIILGSKGFFEGIDIPGDGLTCVIVDKIPNKSLEEPLLKAIMYYKKINYQQVNYPQLCISVKQGYGRLIRSIYDYGYFCILDSGSNSNTILKLEKDLQGPKFIRCSTNEIIKSIDKDYCQWKMKNLNYLRSISTKKTFNLESKRIKSFWKVENMSNFDVKYKNVNFIVKEPSS